MMVYVNGQDMARLVLGTLEHDTWMLSPQTFELRPEQYLAGLETFLAEHELERADIAGFVLVQGPGSATALRMSHAMVNALAFALQVPIIGLEKPTDADDGQMAKLSSSLDPQGVKAGIALPFYTHAPKITESTRDALKRKLT